MSDIIFLRKPSFGEIQFVGGKSGSAAADTNVTLSLTTLTGGLGSTALAGDIVVVAVTISDISNLNVQMVTSGYTELTDLYGNDTVDTNMGVYWKIMGGTPDTTAVSSSSGGTGNFGHVAVALVFRGVHQTTPIDVTTTTATGSGSVLANPPSITPSTSGAWVLIAGGGGHQAGDHTYTHSTYTIVSDGYEGLTHDVTGALGYWDGWTSGATNPDAFSFTGTDDAAYSWAAATLALRPA